MKAEAVYTYETIIHEVVAFYTFISFRRITAAEKMMEV